ncbi:MAG: mechanosensitive ion channel family protein [Candidatus Zambryskibacteria bacterium]|nr:mechanosensitive ion channel family protein [Candidatus Zambryskibacteria bacterium]
MEILNYSLGQNTVYDYLTLILVFAALLLVFKIFHDVVLSKLGRIAERTKTDLDETFVEILKNLRPPFYIFLSFYFALKFVVIPDFLQSVFDLILVIWVVYQVVRSLAVFVDYAAGKYKLREENEGTKAAITLIGRIVKGILWVVAILFALSNLGVNVTSLMAGLGIGGIAVALALQSVLSDLFSSFSIYFDKPFVPGDFIIVGSDMGVVENIGIKTTRIRALQGEEIVISNQELTSTRVHNFKKLQERRVVFSFGVVYGTSTAELKKIPGAIKKIIDSVDLVRFDRAHFFSFGESSLDFEVVYYLQSSDYNEYMDIHQKILLKIKDALEKQDVSIAFPTRTVHLEGGE